MNKGKKLILIICGIFLSILITTILIFNQFPKHQTVYIDSSIVIPHLKDGDVLLRLGDGAWSNTFRDFSITDKRFSHLGIVNMNDENITVINSVGFLRNKEKGVAENTLDDFLSVAKSIGVFRVKSLDGSFISEIATEYIDCPFDWSFDLNEEEYIYCTELLYVVLKRANMEDILVTHYMDHINKDVILLDAISASPNVIDEIFYYTAINTKKSNISPGIITYLYNKFIIADR